MHVVNEELVKSVVEQKLDVISLWKIVVRKSEISVTVLIFGPGGEKQFKPVLGIPDIVRLKQACSATKTSENIEI